MDGRLRVATYNIRALRDDGEAVVRVVRSLEADVVCIQEAPRFLFWRRRCHRLARASAVCIALHAIAWVLLRSEKTT